jgi:ketosteroid isomerase-like protein
MHGVDAGSQDVRCAERALYDAMIARDFAALERILDPDLAYVHSTAVTESKKEYLAGVLRGLYEYEHIETPDARIRVYGQVALIDGVCDMRVGVTGAPKESIRLLFVLVWRNTGDGWRLVHRHATRIAAA